jgi:hypothetical protein
MSRAHIAARGDAANARRYPPEIVVRSSETPGAGWLARLFSRLFSLRGPSLPSQLRRQFADEVAATNRRRLRALLPLAVLLHLAHVAVFITTGEKRAALAPIVVRWRDGIALTHAITLAIALVIGALVLRKGGGKLDRWLGPVAAATYLAHGAIIAGVDQLSVPTVTPFIGYSLGIAVVFALGPRVSVAIYGVALAIFVASVSSSRGSSTPRASATSCSARRSTDSAASSRG